MNFTKLAITTVAAVALTVCAGTSLASATTLCKVNQETCAEANRWSDHSKILYLGPTTKITGTISVTCHSHLSTLTETHFGIALLSSVTLDDWTVCGGCSSVTTTALPKAKLVATSSGNGTLTTTSTTEIELKGCPFGLTCKAKIGEVSLPVKGGSIGSTATMEAVKVPVTFSGGLCGSTGSWNAYGEGSEPYVVTDVNGVTSGSLFISAKP